MSIPVRRFVSDLSVAAAGVLKPSVVDFPQPITPGEFRIESDHPDDNSSGLGARTVIGTAIFELTEGGKKFHVTSNYSASLNAGAISIPQVAAGPPTIGDNPNAPTPLFDRLKCLRVVSMRVAETGIGITVDGAPGRTVNAGEIRAVIVSGTSSFVVNAIPPYAARSAMPIIYASSDYQVDVCRVSARFHKASGAPSKVGIHPWCKAYKGAEQPMTVRMGLDDVTSPKDKIEFGIPLRIPPLTDVYFRAVDPSATPEVSVSIEAVFTPIPRGSWIEA